MEFLFQSYPVSRDELKYGNCDTGKVQCKIRCIDVKLARYKGQS